MAARRLKLRFRLALLACVMAGLGLAILPPARQALEQRDLVRAEERKLAALTTSNIKLHQRLSRLSDPDYLETVAREQLGLVRPGEVSFVVEDPEGPPVKAKPPPAKPKPWYEKAWSWVQSKV
ncbi:MAG: FtsB family cell division protein [Actinomycetota bacterium]